MSTTMRRDTLASMKSSNTLGRSANGTVRAMSFSIFTYAIFTGLCGFATEAWHIAILRFIASLGMGGEWALGVALVNELWTTGNRAWVAGAIGAAANIGYLLVGALSLGLNTFIGNVREWTADQFAADYFLRIKDAPLNPFVRPENLYPRSVRGGGWDDDPQRLRSAARLGSDPEWKRQDPQLPKSIWYHTDARSLGFRIVRPLEVPSVEEMYFYWNSATGMRDSE